MPATSLENAVSSAVNPSSMGRSNALAASLLASIESRQARVAVIGMGYVGLPLAVCVAKVGFNVAGIDLSAERIAMLNQGESYINDVTSVELAECVKTGRLVGVTEPSVLAESDIVIICVPTPLTKNRDPDISFIRQATESIAQHIRPGQLILLESTTYPGTTTEVVQTILEKTGLKVGTDFFPAFSPERVDPGNARYTTQNTNKIVGGTTPACTDVATAFYQTSILKVIPVSSPSCAEMVKVFENTFRAVNIALVNELALLCDRMGLNVWEVVEAAGTKPFGMMSFQPGPGVGGHCIPIDPFYLTWKAREYNFHTRFIELAGEINSFMPEFVRDKAIRALGERGKPLYGSTVLILGMAYKKDLSDWRTSPGIDCFNLLQQAGAKVIYHDPHVPTIQDAHGQSFESVDLTPQQWALVDCAVLITDHTAFDLDQIVANAPMVLDTRNATRSVTQNRDKIILL